MSQSILHKHDPLSLVTLLEGHLPYSLPVYGTILANIPEPGISPDEYGNTHPLSAWATFPPGSPSLEPWVIIAPLGTPLEDQIRLYCSAETSCPDTSASDYPSGLDTVKRALRSYGELSPGFKMVGALNALWVPEVERFLHGQPRGRCNVFLPPLTGLGDSQAPEALEVEGYTVDHGREAEVEVVCHPDSIGGECDARSQLKGLVSRYERYQASISVLSRTITLVHRHPSEFIRGSWCKRFVNSGSGRSIGPHAHGRFTRRITHRRRVPEERTREMGRPTTSQDGKRSAPESTPEPDLEPGPGPGPKPGDWQRERPAG
jgi:hypothetical protein